MPEKEQKYDEFGIPIKSSSVAEQQFDEFGIPVKKKESTQLQSPSVDGISDSANGGSVPSTFKDLLAGQIGGKQPLLPDVSLNQNYTTPPSQKAFDENFSILPTVKENTPKKVNVADEYAKAAKEEATNLRLPQNEKEEQIAIKVGEIENVKKKQSDISFQNRVLGKIGIPSTSLDESKSSERAYRDPVYGKILSNFSPGVISGNEEDVLNYLKENDYYAGKLEKGKLTEEDQYNILKEATAEKRKNFENQIEQYKASGVDKLTNEYIDLINTQSSLYSNIETAKKEIEGLRSKKDATTDDKTNLQQKINNYNDLVVKYNDLEQQKKPYANIENDIKGYVSSIDELNKLDLRSSKAIDALPVLKESIRKQRVAEGEEQGNVGESEYGIMSDVGTKLANATTKAAQNILAFVPKQAGDISKAILNKKGYGVGDQIADFITGGGAKPFVESTKYSDISKFNPLKDPYGFVRSMTGGVAQQLPTMAAIALTDGVVVSPRLATSIGQGSSVIKSISNIGKADALSTTLSGYINSYKDYSEEASKKGLDPRAGLAFASSMSMLEGLSENIMPDKKLFTPDVKKRMLNEYIQMIAKGDKPVDAAKKIVLSGIESGGKESLEEFTVMAGKYLNEKAIELSNPDIKANVPELSEMINTGVIAFTTGGLAGSVSQKRGINTEKNLAYLSASKDIDLTKEMINGLIKSGAITRDQALDFMDNVNKFNQKKDFVPSDISDIKKADIISKLNDIDKLDEKISSDNIAEPIKKSYESQKKQKESEINDIIKDGQYEIQFKDDIEKSEDVVENKPVEEVKTQLTQQPAQEVLTPEEKDELDTLTALNEDGFLGEEEKARMAELQQKQTAEAPVSQNTYFQDKVKEENRDLSEDHKVIEQKFAKDLDDNYEQRKAEYLAKNGNVFDTDRARELSPDYKNDPTISQAVHVPAREFVTRIYKEELAKQAPEGKKNIVTWTSGGSGVGKSELVNRAKASKSQIIVDTNLSKFDDAVKDIEEALAAGKAINIQYMFKDPVKAFKEGVMGGKTRGGRTVPVDVAVGSNEGSLETIKQLAEKYKDNKKVNIEYFDNNGKRGEMKPLSLEDVKQIKVDYKKAKEEIQNEIDRQYNEGIIDDRQYKGFSGIKDEEFEQRRSRLRANKGSSGGSKTLEGDGDGTKQKRHSAGNRLFNEPIKGIAEIADKYYERVFGRPRSKFSGVSTIDKEKSKKIAKAYAEMKHDPNNKDVKAAYEALAKETIDQYNSLIDAGYSIEITDGDTYANSQELIDDVSKTKKIKIFSTEAGFGQNAITDKQRSENPMLKDSGLVDVNGKKLLVNDVFRAVHDLFGHGELGNSFGPKGEENAYQVHARMFSPLARKALATETRGQNSFVNFSGINEEVQPLIDKARKLRDEGKEEEAKEVAKQIVEKLSFADQKIGLLPDEFINIEEEETPKKQDKNAVTERNITESDQQQYQEGDARGKTAKAGDSDRVVKGGQKQAKQQKEVVSEKPVTKKPATLENEMKALEEEEAAEETTTEEDQATKQKLFDDVKAMKAQGANVAELKFKGILERAYKAKADKKIKRTTYTEIKNMIKDVYGGKAVNKEDAKIRVSGMIQEVKDKLLGQGYKNITLGTILPITPKNIADLLDLTEKLIHKGIDAGYGIAEATQRALNAVKKVPLYKRLVDNKELNPAEFEKMLDTAIAQKLKGTKEAMASPDITKGTDKRKTTKRLKTDKSFDDILTEMGNDGETYAVLNLKKADKHVKGVVKEFERNGLLEDLAVEIAAGRNPFYPGIKEYASFHVADRLRSLAEKEGNAMQKSALTKLAAEVLAQRAKNVTAAGQTISVEKLVAEQLPLSKEGITDHVQSVMSTVQDTHMSEEQKNEVKTAFTDINSLLLDPNVQEAINKAAEEKINEIAEATKGKEWVDKVDKTIDDLKIDLEDC